MRYIMTMLMFAFAATSISYGGTVTFEPMTDTVVQPGETVEFEVSVTPSESLGAFDVANIVMGSFDLEIASFHYDINWPDNFFPHPPPVSAGIYPSDLFVGGFLAVPRTESIIGVLTVGVPGDLAPGEYTILVDSDFDNGTSSLDLGSTTEPLFGSAMVTVVPEPTTMVLLGIGTVAMFRRRRK